ncbi:MAG TPA: hypothetical protein VFX49_11695 [Chloroflexota bacterium]|nr:hypothetical protein [Chloroflexota bacterium]
MSDVAEFSDEPRPTRVCGSCQRRVYVDDHHSPEECSQAAEKLERLRLEGDHPSDWLPEGWN